LIWLCGALNSDTSSQAAHPGMSSKFAGFNRSMQTFSTMPFKFNMKNLSERCKLKKNRQMVVEVLFSRRRVEQKT